MPTSSQASPFIADPDQRFLKALELDSSATTIRPLLSPSEVEAIHKIETLNCPISGVFFNASLGKTLGIPLIRAVFQNRPMTRLYLLSDTPQSPFSAAQLKDFKIHRVLLKPLSLADIIKVTIQDQEETDKSQALSPFPTENTSAKQEIDFKDAHFVPFDAARLMAGAVGDFDLYIRIKEHRYLKILRAGEAFAPERLSSYLSKGVRSFYMLREAHEKLLQKCNELSISLLKDPSASMDTKSASVLSHGQLVANFLRHSGVDEKAIEQAHRFILNARRLASQLAKDNTMVLRILNDSLQFDHSVACSMIVSLVMQPLHMQGERSNQIVGLTTLLHDIALVDENSKFNSHDEEILDAIELDAYHQHPVESALMVRNIPGIDASVVQAIEQHHEKRDRTGFPHRIGSLNRVAEILSASEQFLRLIERSQKTLTLKPWDEMKRAVLPQYSEELASAFRQAFTTSPGRKPPR